MEGNSVNQKILIVEDSPTQAERLRYLLEKHGFEVSAACNGREALDSIGRSMPTIVISDIMMPEMDGYQLCERIRMNDAIKDMPVVLLTTLSDTKDILRALESGADNFITKPYNEKYLIARIEQILMNIDLRKNITTPVGLEVFFEGQKFFVTTERRRILDLLLSTYESVVRKNSELIEAQEKLRSLNRQLEAEILERRQAEESLKKRNSELSVIHKVSSAISKTIDVKELFAEIMETITGLDILRFEHKGVVFIAEGDRLNLAYMIGCPDEFVNSHSSLRIGTCLCGLAAEKGEIIVSKNSDNDDRHTIKPSGITPHGHIIIPLKAENRLVGVLCLYLLPDIIDDIDESKMEMLYSLGNQIGIALNNARLYEETRSLSLHDPLTGLANRRLMEINLEKDLAIAKRYGKPLSVVMLDIDYFKKYNDKYGHTAGDRLLSGIGRILSREVRASDLAVRYGGEEFLIIMPETDLQKAREAAERLRKAVENEAGVTISLGVSSYRNDILKKEDLIVCADSALYRAKQNGRNRVEAG
ncbi:MAG: diguanylate cyclase [Nitrospirae bacterium]|nr:diguanylate cyclase [Nitrospirota bacterium]